MKVQDFPLGIVTLMAIQNKLIDLKVGSLKKLFFYYVIEIYILMF